MGIQDVDQGAVTQAISQSQGISQSQATQSSQGMQQETSRAPSTQNTLSPNSDDPLNLESVLKFKFGDREWTPEQLRKSILMHSDYTKKTQAVAETQKYWDNLDTDLENVRNNPQLRDAFLQTYPQAFHKYLRGGNENPSQSNQSQQNQLPPELLQKLSKVDELSSYIQEQQIKAHEANIDAKFSTLSKKYPDGIEDVVLARAQALMDRGTFVTDEVWEKLWKKSHEDVSSRFEARQKTTLQTQRAANQSARGPASGGGTPTGAPVKARTIKDATEMAIRSLSGKG